LPADAGVCWKTAAGRFYRCTDSGVWRNVLGELQQDADEHGRLDRSKHFVDGSSVRAHQHAAGAKGGTAENEAFGRSRGGLSTEFHVRADDNGKPLALLLSAGQRHEATLSEPLMEHKAVYLLLVRRTPTLLAWWATKATAMTESAATSPDQDSRWCSRCDPTGAPIPTSTERRTVSATRLSLRQEGVLAYLREMPGQ
jgi:transposase